MERVILELETRETSGTSGAAAVRRSGKIPGVLYGNGREAVSVSINARVMREAVNRAGGRHAIFDVSVAGGKAFPAMIKDVQLHPLRDTAIHVDFVEVNLKRVVQTPLSIVIIGESIGVKNFGGLLQQPMHEIVVEALPDDLPEHIEVDITELNLGDSVKLSDLTPPPGVTFIGDADLVFATINVPRGAAVPGDDDYEGGEAVEGDAPAADGGATAEGSADDASGGAAE